MFLFEITDVSNHNSDEPEEDPKCAHFILLYVGTCTCEADSRPLNMYNQFT